MRRFVLLTLLIQICVQSFPVFAEDVVPAIDVPTEETVAPPAASGSVLPPAGTGAVTLPVADSGAIVAGSGTALLPTATGATVTAPPPTVPAPAPRPVRIVVSEVMWMGSNVSTADEWVEIAAFSSGATSLPRSVSGWTLSSVKAGVETRLARLPDLSLASGAVLVVANNRAAASRLLLEPAVVTTGMSLPNTQLLLRLKDASGAIVDEIDDGVGAPMAGANPSGGAKASMERADPWAPGTAAQSWKTATLSLGFDDGPPIFGTPGFLGTSAAAPSSSSASSVVSSVSPSSASSASSLPVGVPVVPVQPPPLLRLTEVLANPVGADTDEWLEIGSFDAAPIDLAETALRVGTTRFASAGTLQPGEYRRFGKLQTGLSLPNAGGFVELLWRDKVIDAWAYVETAEGVSLGRAQDGTVVPQCVPSPDAANAGTAVVPRIVVQSSSPSTGKLSLNLEAVADAGSLAGGSCAWSYPDGYASVSCNPPSHTMPGPLLGDVVLSFHDYCGNTVIQVLHVDIAGPLEKEKDAGPVCMPTAFTGVVVSEFAPNPAGDEAAGEWIELANPTPEDRALCGWSLDDGERGSDPYPLDRWRLPPGETLVLPRTTTDIALNNDADAVRLFAPLPQGGSAAREIVRYVSSLEGRSWALRDDGAWLWTDPTPGTANAFRPVRWPEEILARITAALPNPAGKDADGGEWVEIANVTPYPLPLTGWTIDAGANTYTLDSVILAPREWKRIDAPGLANTHATARLLDPEGLAQSALAWTTARDDEAIEAREAAAHVSGLSFVGSDNCVRWRAIDADGHRVDVELDGIVADDTRKCTEYVSVLLEGKKFDQEMYSDSEISSGVFLRGTNVASLLVREGLAFATTTAYASDETDARANRRGAWATDERIALIDESRRIEAFRTMLSSEGLRLKFSQPSGIVQPGASIAIDSNVPASIMVASGTGAFEPYVGPIVIAADTDLRVQARANVEDASGTSVFAYSFQSYGMLKSRYPNVLVSEVYPSPPKGESEWVELYNPTDERVSLTGWLLDDTADAGSKPAALPPGSSIGPRERKIFSGSTVAWNNDGDDVRLIDPRGHVSHAVAYPGVKAGGAFAVSFGADDTVLGACSTIHPTPGAGNRCADGPPKIAKKTSTKTAVTKKPKHEVRYRNLVEAVTTARFVRELFAAVGGGNGVSNARSAGILPIAVFGLLCLLITRLAVRYR